MTGRDVNKAKELMKAAGVKTPLAIDFMVPNNPEARSVAEVIGKGTVTEQGGKVMISAQLDMDDATAQKAYRKINNKLVKGLSIGFQSIKKTFGEENGRYIRRIQELKLMEVSIVTFPALAQAQITQVKQRDEIAERLKAVEAQLSALAEQKAAPAAPAKPEPVADHSAELAAARLRLALLN